jgi:hypothetical protein
MIERNIKCLKCQRAMQKGYIPDATYGGVVLGTWVEGEVETGFLGAISTQQQRCEVLSRIAGTDTVNLDLSQCGNRTSAERRLTRRSHRGSPGGAA